MKIAVITCYKDPDYVRARVLREALKLLPGVQIVVVKNEHRGLLRYPEVMRKIWRLRKQTKLDAYLLTFRGQELLPFVLWAAGKKPVIFDELIVPIAYANDEHHKRSFTTSLYYFMARRSEALYRRWLKRCHTVLADTAAHAELSARVSQMNLSKYGVIPVGTDEKVFQPAAAGGIPAASFSVFYYSSGMQPLHGLGYVLEAAEALRDNPSVEFLIVGGKKSLAQAVAAAARRGARITYQPWIPFEELPEAIRTSGINLGGPFGDTPQAHHVITTKTFQMLACAAPVIVGDSEATKEYFVDKQNALIVPQADTEALVKMILWAQKHPAELRTVAANGRKLFEKEFSTQAIARLLQPIVANL